MISLKFDFSEFISAVKDRDKHIILSMAETEAREAEKISEMQKNGQDYVEAIIGLIYLLRHSQKPNWIKEKHFKMFRAVCEKLAAKKQISSDLLKILDS
ncbi:MAG: hypothetical protein JW787_07175 [Sedimentisphaerales bacterium]|nr:hypothetical protein [Sedimentisphaerales bacterium]